MNGLPSYFYVKFTHNFLSSQMSNSNTIVSIANAIQEATISNYVDEDICEYIQSTLADNPNDSDARTLVSELIQGYIDDDDLHQEVINTFFQSLDQIQLHGNEQIKCNLENDDLAPLQKLSQAVTIKDNDVQTFASGLRADPVDDMNMSSGELNTTSIASFYANMIDASGNEAAISERKRRKRRQQELREEIEEAERKRALQEAMDILQEDQLHDNQNDNPDGILSDDAGTSSEVDVHLKDFNLPNLRGGGQDLLQNSSLTLARGRRYGLMGRNGCGKSTLLSYVSRRQIPNAIPKNMTMLLVRQEIGGNDHTPVETVLKSDVKREALKLFITRCGEEIDKLSNVIQGDDDDNDDNTKVDESNDEVSKGRQRILDRKKAKAQKAARMKVTMTDKSSAKLKQQNIEQQKAKLSEKLSLAYEKLARIEEEDGVDPEPRARKILSGLGFSEEMQNKPTSQLSGGWRMRVALSCALFADPSLLLLDEPTNHLDLPGVLWLEKYLTTKFKGTLVVVSHDRHFLNEVVTDVVHFHRNNLKTYRGDINNFEVVREEDKQRQIRLRENQEAKKAHLQSYIDLHSKAGENGVKAARQRKSKMKKLEKVGVMAQEGKKWKASYDGDAEEVEEYVEDEKVEINFPDPGGFDEQMVTLENVSFGYSDDNILLKDVDLTLNSNSRTALLGRNGEGKSTLIKVIVGALQPSKGKAFVNARAKIEYLAQHQLEQLDPDGTPMQTMIDRYPGDRSSGHILSLRRWLANYGLGGDVLPNQRIHTMSGGQKCRLCLACAMYRNPHLLILDEPTNHLDLETTEALVQAIREFKGGVLLVSHDQYLLTSVCKDLYVVEKGHLHVMRHGNSTKDAFEEYKKAIVLGRR